MTIPMADHFLGLKSGRPEAWTTTRNCSWSCMRRKVGNGLVEREGNVLIRLEASVTVAKLAV